MKERLGLGRKAQRRHVQVVLEKGKSNRDARGRARRFCDQAYLRYGGVLRIYGEFVYAFKGNVLVTVLPLPRGMARGFKERES